MFFFSNIMVKSNKLFSNMYLINDINMNSYAMLILCSD